MASSGTLWICLIVVSAANMVFANENDVCPVDNLDECRNLDAVLTQWIEQQISKDFNLEYQKTDKAIHVNNSPDLCYGREDITEIRDSSDETISDLGDLSGSGTVVFATGSELTSDHFREGQVPHGTSIRLNITSEGTVYVGLVRDCHFYGRVLGFDSASKHVTFIADFDESGHLMSGSALWNRRLSVFDNLLIGYYYKSINQTETSFNYLDWVKNIGLFKAFSGDDVAFIYPDLSTAIQGSFVQGKMKETKQVVIQDIQENSLTGSPILKFSEPFGNTFHWEQSDKVQMVQDPMLRDPYERKMVEVRTSSIKNAGQGVFLLKDVPAGTIISYFNGIRLREEDIFGFNRLVRPRSAYLVELGMDDEFLDIPPEFTSWDDYQASAGHKVNHDKVPNASYSECVHPRFGRILCLYATKDLKSGTELKTHYNVSFDKNSMKELLKTALNIGHAFSGKSKSEFVKTVRPYLKAASKIADTIKIEDLIRF